MLHYIIVEVVSGSQSLAVNKIFTSHSFETLHTFWVWVATKNRGKVKRKREREGLFQDFIIEYRHDRWRQSAS